MPDTTFEEASRCPSCKNPGKPAGTQRPQGTARGTVIHVFVCENDRCEYFEDRWLVQTNPDGSVPTPGTRGPKVFERPGQSTTLATAARGELAMIEYMSTHPGADERMARRALGGYERS